MRTTCWLVFVCALCVSAFGCGSEDPVDDRPDADTDADTGRPRQREIIPTGPNAPNAARGSEPKRAAQMPMDAEPSARRPAPPDAGMDFDAGDSDGGSGPVATGIRYAGGDGSSCENAVIILGAASSFDGILAEYDWLQKHYPGAKVTTQALSMCNGHWADILTIRTTAGETRDVYFDIEDFFGK